MNKPSKAKRKAAKRRIERMNVMHLGYAINTFDHPLEFTKDRAGGYTAYMKWSNPLGTYEGDKHGELKTYYIFREGGAIELINKLYHTEKITDDIRNRLKSMLKSTSRDDWYMAFCVIKNFLK